MDLGRLRALDALATYGSVLAASEALHCTPSAVSQQLTKLDRETGTTLLERDGRGVRLTPAGRLLADHAARVLTAVDEARAALTAYHEEVSGRVAIGAFATACRGLLPAALAELAAAHPQLDTGILELDPYEALDAVTRGRIDIAVVDDWPEIGLDLPGGIAHTVLGDDGADLIVPRGHSLDGAPPGPLARAAGERWIAAPPGTICHDWLLRVLPGVRPDFLVGEFETQLTLVAAGLGVALIPRLARTHTVPGTAIVPIDPIPTRRVIVTWRKANEVRPALGATIAALRSAWSQRSTPSAATPGHS
ncbi:LysR family transcriptional regulator [Hamadaea tsunoensis]|uniref:LysR family transcriptional regulator n=1 Tax=Hamadaea tsunoensis TaxID=53368 RepID=UPI0003FDEB24|nr:LysR family transcriptional regulator [Hamadaea tsunoensis]